MTILFFLQIKSFNKLRMSGLRLIYQTAGRPATQLKPRKGTEMASVQLKSSSSGCKTLEQIVLTLGRSGELHLHFVLIELSHA
jgi:hypothetical protein